MQITLKSNRLFLVLRLILSKIKNKLSCLQANQQTNQGTKEET